MCENKGWNLPPENGNRGPSGPGLYNPACPRNSPGPGLPRRRMLGRVPASGNGPCPAGFRARSEPADGGTAQAPRGRCRPAAHPVQQRSASSDDGAKNRRIPEPSPARLPGSVRRPAAAGGPIRGCGAGSRPDNRASREGPALLDAGKQAASQPAEGDIVPAHRRAGELHPRPHHRLLPAAGPGTRDPPSPEGIAGRGRGLPRPPRRRPRGPGLPVAAQHSVHDPRGVPGKRA